MLLLDRGLFHVIWVVVGLDSSAGRVILGIKNYGFGPSESLADLLHLNRAFQKKLVVV